MTVTTETSTRPVLSERLGAALRTVSFSPGPGSGKVGDRGFEGDGADALRRNLAHTLYAAFHTGQPDRTGGRGPVMTDPRLTEDLRAAVPHDSSVMRAHSVTGSTSPGEAVVLFSGVRVRVPRERITVVDGGAAEVRVPSVMPKRSPGFLMAHGSRGHSLDGRHIIRLYLSVPSHADAPHVWGRTLALLEAAEAGYQAKVLSSRSSYPRHDAIVVYLGPSAWSAVPGVVEGLAGTRGLGEEGSLYTAPLAPGIGWAWEPDDSQAGTDGLSFGQHRSRVIAEALVRAEENGTDRETAVTGALVAAGIPPEALHRSHRSPDIGL